MRPLPGFLQYYSHWPLIGFEVKLGENYTQSTVSKLLLPLFNPFKLAMDFLSLASWCLGIYAVIQFIRFILADADLTVLWIEWFGKKPSKY